MLLPDKTAQPCAAAVLAYIDEGLTQLERLANCHLKAGLVQGVWLLPSEGIGNACKGLELAGHLSI
jgi:hypothetical protein